MNVQEIINEIEADEAAVNEEAFKLFCKTKLKTALDRYKKAEKNATEDLNYLNSLTIEKLEELFNRNDMCSNGSPKEIYTKMILEKRPL